MPDKAQGRTAADIFGGNSDGGVRMFQFLDAMCRGCRQESAKARREGEGGGFGCEIAARAIADPYGALIPEWSTDAPWPPHMTEGEDGLDPGNPWPVCTSWQPRGTRSDKGTVRQVPGQAALF